MNWTENLRGATGAPSAAGAPSPPSGNADHRAADHIAASRDLLARTAELPDTRRELMNVLSEYRAALFAFAIDYERLSGSGQTPGCSPQEIGWPSAPPYPDRATTSGCPRGLGPTGQVCTGSLVCMCSMCPFTGSVELGV